MSNCAFPNLEELTAAIILELKASDDPCIPDTSIYNWVPDNHEWPYIYFKHIGTNPTIDPCQNQDTVRMYTHQNCKWGWNLSEIQCVVSCILKMFKKRSFKFFEKIDNVKHVSTAHTIDSDGDNVLITDLYIFYS